MSVNPLYSEREDIRYMSVAKVPSEQVLEFEWHGTTGSQDELCETAKILLKLGVYLFHPVMNAPGILCM